MADFRRCVEAAGLTLVREPLHCLQVNVGYRCNLACSLCHVEGGPQRTEVMSAAVMDDVLDFAARAGVAEIDITGGAPEMNPNLWDFIVRCRQIPSVERVLVRTNLTIWDEPDYGTMPEFFAANGVELIASLPSCREESVDQQRGTGVHRRSIAMLQKLNVLGYGHPESPLKLHLVYNPQGHYLPRPQGELEAEYQEQLNKEYGIVFNSLFTITNMPVGRFRTHLEQEGLLADYLELLNANMNLHNLPQVMCRTTLSVNWEGKVYDCDFNQMLTLSGANGSTYIGDLDATQLAGQMVATGDHCFACVAGSGSSCQGSLV